MAIEQVMQAAGGVVWRKSGTANQSGSAVDLLLVHRPKYDDWTFPKGKCDPGETLAETAVREIGEETGLEVRLGMPLRNHSYPIAAGTKSVTYWCARPVGSGGLGSFLPNAEVDEVRWVRMREADELLTYGHDHEILEAFRELRAAKHHKTRTLVVVRHGKATERSDWDGDDLERPLAARGEEQAVSLVSLLAAYGIRDVVSSPAARCAQTVEPYAKSISTYLEIDDRLAEDAKASDVRRSVESLLDQKKRVVVCTHGPTLPLIMDALGLECPEFATGGMLVIHHLKGRILATEKFEG